MCIFILDIHDNRYDLLNIQKKNKDIYHLQPHYLNPYFYHIQILCFTSYFCFLVYRFFSRSHTIKNIILLSV